DRPGTARERPHLAPTRPQRPRPRGRTPGGLRLRPQIRRSRAANGRSICRCTAGPGPRSRCAHYRARTAGTQAAAGLWRRAGHEGPQEAITNASRHAPGTPIDITAADAGVELRLKIENAL